MTFRPVYAVLTLVAVTLLTTGCGDPVPDDYTPQVSIEAILTVDEPITNIRLYRSVALTDSFNYRNAAIRSAEMTITASDGTTHVLEFVDDSTGGFYRSPDTAYRVSPQVKYDLVARADGTTISGTTTAPPRIEWTKTVGDTVFYPGRDKELDPSISDPYKVFWTRPEGYSEYMIAMTCLDTLNYGTFLTPPTDEKNNRIRDSEFDDDTPLGKERTRAAYTVSTGVFSWSAFKWFGQHELTVYCGDRNFINWFKQVTFTRQYNTNLSSVVGGLGTFSSVSKVSKVFFLKKNAP